MVVLAATVLVNTTEVGLYCTVKRAPSMMTVLVPAGSSVDILADMSNPGSWMLHCHIAEHLQSLMMMHFDVEE